MEKLKLIFAGAGEFGLPTLRALHQAGHEILQVVSQPDRPAGRGQVLTPTAISTYAIEHSLPLIRTADINAESLPAADAMVVIAFGQKISQSVVTFPRFGAINLHSSLLPKYRGAVPINAAILGGESTTGNSVIRLADKMDAGHILGQSRLAIGETETAGELHDRLSEDGAELVPRVLEQLATGRAVEQPQDHSLATLARKFSKQSGQIDWSRSAADIARQIRGMHPWPGCRVNLVDSALTNLATLTLVRARPFPSLPESEPGKIDSLGRVGTGDGSLEIIELQPAGKKPMTLAAFKNGRPWQVGYALQSI